MHINEQALERFLRRVIQDYKDERSTLEESAGAVSLLIEAVRDEDHAAVNMWLATAEDPSPVRH